MQLIKRKRNTMYMYNLFIIEIESSVSACCNFHFLQIQINRFLVEAIVFLSTNACVGFLFFCQQKLTYMYVKIVEKCSKPNRNDIENMMEFRHRQQCRIGADWNKLHIHILSQIFPYVWQKSNSKTFNVLKEYAGKPWWNASFTMTDLNMWWQFSLKTKTNHRIHNLHNQSHTPKWHTKLLWTFRQNDLLFANMYTF